MFFALWVFVVVVWLAGWFLFWGYFLWFNFFKKNLSSFTNRGPCWPFFFIPLKLLYTEIRKLRLLVDASIHIVSFDTLISALSRHRIFLNLWMSKEQDWPSVSYLKPRLLLQHHKYCFHPLEFRQTTYSGAELLFAVQWSALSTTFYFSFFPSL